MLRQRKAQGLGHLRRLCTANRPAKGSVEGRSRAERHASLRRLGNPIDRRDAYRMVTKIAKVACIPRHISPHSLRHAAITTALDMGKDVRVVQKFTRHRTLDMVLKYDDARGDLAGTVAVDLSRRREEDP